MTKSIEDLQWRYATKKFDPDKKLNSEQLETLIQAFNLTATSYGLQPCRLVVVENTALKEKIVPMAYGQRQVVDASAVLVLCTKRMSEEYLKDYFDRVQQTRDTSDEVLSPFRKQLIDKFTDMSAAQIESWARNQAYITLGTLMSTCAQQRIDSCPMEGFIPEQLDQLLELESKGLKSVLMLPVGYRAADDMFADMKKVRLPLEDSVIKM